MSDPKIKHLCDMLKLMDINYQKVDTVAGWGCLDQDWIEFEREVETSYGWCSIKGLEAFHDYFHEGSLLMHLSYVKVNKCGQKEYTPHH
jgi:hypothetical protein